jgi:hypothetical protein
MIAGVDLAEEQAGYHLRGESSSLSQSIYADWFAHLSLPLFSHTLRPISNYVSHSSQNLLCVSNL